VKGISFLKRNVAAVICGVVLFFSSCKTEERPPEGILTKPDMVRVLSEVYIMEEKINRLALTRDSSEKVFDRVRDKIALTTGVPDSVLKKSFDYYLDRPKELEQIYAALVDTLQLREQRMPRHIPEQ
jgi:hypothetical protein